MDPLQWQKNELKQAVIDIFGATPILESRPKPRPLTPVTPIRLRPLQPQKFDVDAALAQIRAAGEAANQKPTPAVTQLAITPRQYQLDALAAIQAAEARGVQRQIVCLPTGSGKTIILSMLALQRRVRTLILVHRDELLQQTIEKLHMVSGDPTLPIGVVKGPRDEHHQPFVVANIQTLGREKRLARVMRDFGLLIVDECHHVQGDNQYGKVLQTLGAFEDGGPLTVGFTATPFRANGEPLLLDGVEGCFQQIVHTLPLPWMVEHGHLVPIEGVQLVIGDIDLSGVKVHHGDYDDEDLGRAMLAANAPAMIAKGFAPMAKGRQSIIFCPTTGIVNSMEHHLKNAGLRVASVIGSTKLDARHTIYRQLREGQLDAIVSCMVLTEGFDEPSVDCVVIARPTKSKVLFHQAIGRGLRKHDISGKDHCLLVDATGCTDRHGLLSLAAQLGIMRGPSGTIERPDQPGEKQERQEVDGSCTAREITLVQNLLHWSRTRKGCYIASLGEQTIRIRPERATSGTETYTIETLKKGEKVYTIRGEHLSLEYCQGMASDTAKDAKVLHLAGKDAAWRRGPRSEAQENFARKRGIPIDPVWTMGDMSDLISSIAGDWYPSRKIA